MKFENRVKVSNLLDELHSLEIALDHLEHYFETEHGYMLDTFSAIIELLKNRISEIPKDLEPL